MREIPLTRSDHVTAPIELIWRSTHWKLLPRGISHIPTRFRVWFHLTNTLTIYAANVIHTATEATTKTSLWVNIGSSISHVNWSLSVCYCWSDCFSTSPIQHGTRIKKTRWKKSRQVKGHLAYIRPYTIMPSIDRFFPHFKRLLRRRNTSTGHSLEFPSKRSHRTVKWTLIPITFWVKRVNICMQIIIVTLNSAV
jgi:hypothetical protein